MGEVPERARGRETGLVRGRATQLDVGLAPGIGVGQLDLPQKGHDEAPVDSGLPAAVIGETAVTHRQQLAVLSCGDLQIIDLIALLADVHQAFVTGLDPAHGAFELARHVRKDQVLAVERRLDAKRPALVARRDDAHLLGRDVENIRQREALDMRALRSDISGQAVGVGPVAQDTAWFHWCNAGAVNLEAFFNHHVGLREDGFDLLGVSGLVLFSFATGESHREHFVGAVFFVDDGSTLGQRRFRVQQYRERLVIDVHALGSIGGDIFVACEYQRHRFAVKFDFADGKRPEGRVVGRQIGHHHRLRHRFDLVLNVITGDHRDYARQGFGRGFVDALYVGVGVFAAYEGGVQHTRQRDIADVAPLTRY